MVGRVDCTHDFEVCDLLVNHNQASNQSYPYMVMFTAEKGYRYEGAINAEAIYNDFLQEDKFKQFPVHGGKDYTTSRVIADGKALINQIMEKNNKEKQVYEPHWLDEQFAHLFAPYISWIFFQLNLDYFRKNTKILLFSAGILVPILIVLYHLAEAVVGCSSKKKKE
uniref:Uncharacterized protein n=1 Tax=Strombidium inclinatum TaxID=197538 RepID=A0A7S3N1I5_9SPIT|mmetsp:Transcript_32454/g.49654  ORF Transcript_32454/g.49654 Transcript_32454/m.49654 type:complete len:167 (+) Transcript_32454:288-788(+)